jgi:hypothetical protein
MRDGLLTEYIRAGIPYLKQVSGLPEGLLPDFAAVARQLGDKTMLKLAEPLGLGERMKTLLAQAPDPDSLPDEIWQQGVANWQPLEQVLSVTMALLRTCEKVDALEGRGVLKIDFALIRGLAVTAYAPFAPNGGELLSRLAGILGGTVAEPARLLDRYIMMAVVTGDTDTLAGVDSCILGDPAWREWSERILATGKDFPLLPRAIGISPPLTSGLKQVVVNMIMEVINADHIRDTGD